MAKQKVAMLTAGGLAPCLSSAVGGLIERYTDIAPDIELVAYRSRLSGPAARRPHRDHPRHAREGPHPAPPWRLADRQQPRQAHQCRRLRQARPGQGRPEPAAGRRRAAGCRRHHHPAHDRRRRHQHDGGRSRRLSRRQRLRPDRRRPAEDRRQRRGADPPVARRLDGRRIRRAVLRQCQQRTECRPAHARRA